MTTNAIYKECGSDWSHQVSVVATTQWLQRDQTLPLSVKGVACETRSHGAGRFVPVGLAVLVGLYLDHLKVLLQLCAMPRVKVRMQIQIFLQSKIFPALT